MKKIIKLSALIIAFSSVLCNTLILIWNKSFYVGINSFIPEANPIIRFTEVGMGLFTIPIIGSMVYSETKKIRDARDAR